MNAVWRELEAAASGKCSSCTAKSSASAPSAGGAAPVPEPPLLPRRPSGTIPWLCCPRRQARDSCTGRCSSALSLRLRSSRRAGQGCCTMVVSRACSGSASSNSLVACAAMRGSRGCLSRICLRRSSSDGAAAWFAADLWPGELRPGASHGAVDGVTWRAFRAAGSVGSLRISRGKP